MDWQIVVGMVIGLIMNAVWYYWWGYLGARKGKKALGKYRWPVLSLFEHYHWATILTVAGYRLNLPILVGIALPWWLDEGLVQSHKFALGSGHFRETVLIELMIILLWMLVELVVAVV